MGIKNLNRYLTTKCDNHEIRKAHMSEFNGKKVAIDASIYLYRFIGENKLVEHMYLMVSIFKSHGVEPIFIFDGASPPEKKELLAERKEKKRIAEEKYQNIKNQIEDNEDKYEMLNEMEKLKKLELLVISAALLFFLVKI